MANATEAALSNTALEASPPNGRLIGLMIVTVGPALFWTALLGIVAWAIGYEFAPKILVANFLAIAAFLGIVFSALSFSGDERPLAKAP